MKVASLNVVRKQVLFKLTFWISNEAREFSHMFRYLVTQQG
ncbi:hypothetical protein [Hydrogenophaga sp.]